MTAGEEAGGDEAAEQAADEVIGPEDLAPVPALQEADSPAVEALPEVEPDLPLPEPEAETREPVRRRAEARCRRWRP